MAGVYASYPVVGGTGGGGSGTVTSVGLAAPAIFTVTGSPVTTSGTLTIGYSGTALPIANGGTGQTTAPLAINALLPSQASANGQFLTSNGTVASWAAGNAGTVTSVAVSGGTTGLTTSGGPITGAGTITLAGTLAIANGGTGQTTAPLAINALLPSQASANGQFLTSNGTVASWAAGNAGTVTSVAVSGGTTGLTTSGGPITGSGTITLSGTLAVANGGTGVTSSTGTGSVVLSNSPALVTPALGTPASGNLANCTFPTLNQNTTGTAANVTGTVAIANGGTGQITAAAAYNALSPMTTLGDIEYESAANTASRLAGNTTSTKKFLTQTGTGTVSAAPGWNTIAGADVPIVVPGTSAGVVPSTGLPGQTNGVTIPNLTVGQVVSITLGPNAANNGSGAGYNVGVVTVQPGVWVLYALGAFTTGSVVGNTVFLCDLSLSSQTFRTGMNANALTNAGTFGAQIATLPLYVNFTTATSVYAVAAYNFSTIASSTATIYVIQVRIA